MIDPFLGKVFGDKYTLQKHLAAGSHGAVYEAFCASTQTLVAVKILQANIIKNPQITKRFQREASVTSQLSSPHIVKVFDAGVENSGISWIAMELLSGRTLSVHLANQKKLSLDDFFFIFSPLCEALIEAHEKGFLHRDVKPQNVMLTTRQNRVHPVLLDFGIAAVQEETSLTSSGLIHGTPQYMAPEQWEGLRNATSRSDLYSLGLMAYQALSGQMPYQAKNIMAWMKAHLSTEPTPLQQVAPEIPRAVSEAIMRSISKSESERQESVRIFLQELTRAIQTT